MKNLLVVVLSLCLLTSCEIFEQDDNEKPIDLPVDIKSFIEENFAGFEIDEVEEETLCTGESVITVELEKEETNEEEELNLVFDLENVFLFSQIEISTEALPQNILNSIQSNYENFTIEEAEQLEWASDAIQFEVELEKANTELNVLFDSVGTIICEEKDD